jgi:hypothetical protein
MDTFEANLDMIKQKSTNDCSSPDKMGNSTFNIDLFELVPMKGAKLSTQASCYETASTRTEDESNRSVFGEEPAPSKASPTSKVSPFAKGTNDDLDGKMTLKEIISRRCH